jgi:sterol desaturase/sphingolipid hydroxylase (fatty acid hydroxylase superfamily)
MRPEIQIIAAIFVGFAVLEILFSNFFRKPGQHPKDAVVEVIGSVVLLVVTQPMILLIAYLVMSQVFPSLQDGLIGLPIVAQVLLLLVFDDMAQYWWHRTTHKTPWLYNLHRAHHDAEYMSIRIVYRNNIFYYMMMPSLWFSGILIYLGLGKVYAAYIVVKLAVIFGAHSDIRWDKPLYKIKWLSPVMWLVERTISTPSTHSAHHGKHQDDGVTNYKGNYGNLLFFWDVLFGSAKITRRYPEQIGVENLEPMSAGVQLLWPLIRSSKSERKPTPQS